MLIHTQSSQSTFVTTGNKLVYPNRPADAFPSAAGRWVRRGFLAADGRIREQGTGGGTYSAETKDIGRKHLTQVRRWGDPEPPESERGSPSSPASRPHPDCFPKLPQETSVGGNFSWGKRVPTPPTRLREAVKKFPSPLEAASLGYL
jgi:hypothetical protein